MNYSFRKTIRKLKMAPLKNLLLRELAEFADEYGESIFPSLSLLQEHTGISRPWIIKLLKELCEESYLIKLDNSFYKSNLYQLNLKFIEQQSILQTNSAVKKVNNHDDLLVNSVNQLVNSVNLTSKLSLPNLPYNYHLTNNTYVQKVSFSKNSEPVQKPETPVLEEQIIVKPEKPVEAKKTYQQALPFPNMEAEKKPPKAKSQRVAKTRIDPDMELTSGRIQVALEHGLHETWVKVEFPEFKKYYLKNPKLRVSWDESWDEWCGRAATIYNPNGMKFKPHPVKSAINLDTSGHGSDAPVKQAVEDENLNKFIEAHPHLDGRFAFCGASMRKVGNEITISHPSQFSLFKMEIHSWKLKEFFKASKIDFTTETVKKPVQVWPPQPKPYTPPVIEQKPPRYRTLNESYQASGAKSFAANLNALQRSYQNKLQTKIG